jgi:hypothetical protein
MCLQNSFSHFKIHIIRNINDTNGMSKCCGRRTRVNESTSGEYHRLQAIASLTIPFVKYGNSEIGLDSQKYRDLSSIVNQLRSCY